MGCQVVTENDIREEARREFAGSLAGGKRNKAPDDYKDRLLKYIPSEVISVFLLTDSLIRSAPNSSPKNILGWIVFACLLLMTPVYLAMVMHVTRLSQLTISTIAFVVWVFAIGGPFAQLRWYSPLYGGVLLPLFTFGAATFSPQT